MQVDRWLRLPQQPTVFALGDVAASGDPMTAIAIVRQLPWLARLIRNWSFTGSLKVAKPYTPLRSQPLVVPLGPDGGASTLPLTRNDVGVDSRITARLKGRELPVGQYRKQLGYPAKGVTQMVQTTTAATERHAP